MNLNSEPVCVNGVRYYYSHEKLLSVENLLIGGSSLPISISPKLRISAQTFRGEKANRDYIVDEIGVIYNKFLADISTSEPIEAIREQIRDVAVMVPILESTFKLTPYFGSLKPWYGMKIDKIQRGFDPRTLPLEQFESVDIVVPFSYNIFACQPKG